MRKSQTRFYILRNMQPVQVESREYLEWWKHHEGEHIVESTTVCLLDGEHELETIFTGIGPFLYRTALKPGMLRPISLARYSSLGAAKRGHWNILDQLTAAGSIGFVPEAIDF